MNWVVIFNRLFEIINTPGPTYYSGPMFLDVVRETNHSVPPYAAYIQGRGTQSTSRKDYYYDLLMTQPASDRITIVTRILDSIGHHQPERTTALRAILGQGQPQAQGPQAQIPADVWNADRLREHLEGMDEAIASGNYEYTLTLAYTCLEGFYKSYIQIQIPAHAGLNELVPMSVQIRNHIRTQLDANGIVYPDPILVLLSTVTSAVCNARNNFSDSHSGNPAEKWLAVYVRDNVNSIVRMLLHFM